jgi:hypothetical protein
MPFSSNRISSAHRNTPGGRGLEAPGDLLEVEPKDEDIDACLRLLDGRHDRRKAVVGLNDQFHVASI